MPADSITALSGHGSDRRYFRLVGQGSTVIGALNEDVSENRAFLAFAKHFKGHGLPVPSVHCVAPDERAYLQEDLGDTTLFAALKAARPGGGDIPPVLAEAYEKSVRLLPEVQIRAAADMDFSVCYPRAAFDRQSMQWDLNYFKYYFLRLAHIPFHEQSLEDDFQALIDYLVQAPSGYFLYRDFQSRNIMLRGGEPWFIDFQGGRRGALAYDISSILLDAKADLPFAFREHLLTVYLESAAQVLRQAKAPAALLRHVEPEGFAPWFAGFTLIRLLQAMGAYGYRGFHERKPHFLQSVPYAIRNIERLLANWELPHPLPALRETLERITRITRLREIAAVTVPLAISVTSFSYKGSYPVDDSGHGGGFVFDCRCLPNPGRDPALAPYTGCDTIIREWLESREEVGEFLSHIRAMLNQAVQSYHQRNFTQLAISFGCTGGRHRSVYCTEQTAAWLRSLPQVEVVVKHREVGHEIGQRQA
ncbi:MAG: RNase adapter RapZ [Verrucomicrobiota bacterium]|nr:RNase adapter RapZ [Verrucomicrobiota bacterium]